MISSSAASSSPSDTSPPPLALKYLDAPTGPVVASDAALDALRKTRAWALLLAVVMFLYSIVGGGLGCVWLVVLFMRRAEPLFPVGQFIIISTGNLILAPLALIGGVLALRYIAAVGRAYNQRSSEALERAIIAQRRIWIWIGITVIALLAFPVIVALIAGMMGVFP